jgi:hypothetical protein
MTIKDLHAGVCKHVQVETQLSTLAGSTVAVDCSPWAIKSWYNDVPSFYRAQIDTDCEPTHNYRTYLALLINGLANSGVKVLMVLDGAPLPLKAAEHVRRGKVDSRAATMELAAAAHARGDFAARGSASLRPTS